MKIADGSNDDGQIPMETYKYQDNLEVSSLIMK